MDDAWPTVCNDSSVAFQQMQQQTMPPRRGRPHINRFRDTPADSHLRVRAEQVHALARWFDWNQLCFICLQVNTATLLNGFRIGNITVYLCICYCCIFIIWYYRRVSLFFFAVWHIFFPELPKKKKKSLTLLFISVGFFPSAAVFPSHATYAMIICIMSKLRRMTFSRVITHYF